MVVIQAENLKRKVDGRSCRPVLENLGWVLSLFGKKLDLFGKRFRVQKKKKSKNVKH